MTDFNQACPCCCAGGISEEREHELKALLRRDWAVRALDAWVDLEETRSWEVYRMRNGWEIELRADHASDFFQSGNPDSARHAAAEAVFHTLNAEVREQLGECP